MPAAHREPERFDEHFIVRVIRDFFVSLLIVIAVELTVRFAITLAAYNSAEAERTRAAAERLAEDVRAIMLNQGGPVAARTVYPVIERNHERLGLVIAIEPSEATVVAITDYLGTPPEGIPPDWPEGAHHEARVAIKADAFCISCHSASEPGDTLGWVTVRNYRATHVDRWLHDVWLSGLFGLGNIVIHTVVLFVLLRLRMEPLLSLRAVITRLAQAGSDISHRAPVRSADEFGELASGLNHFLDRLAHILEDMGRVLTEMGRIAGEMQNMGGTIESQARALEGEADALTEWVGSGPEALAGLLEGLAAVAGQLGVDAALRARLVALGAALPEATGIAEAGLRLRAGVHRMGDAAADMRLLEERMRALSTEGQRLLERLGHGAQPQADA